MATYYNEFDPKAAAWLRELINAGLIADGEVDERSITDVRADDLRGFNQCHFFAGIGGWSYALRLAGIPDDYPVWTGSCPCQPFSVAGINKGKSDERHLWPAFYDLIKQCRPVTVFGEQVEGAVRHGWLDDLQADMERENYACGFSVLGAHSVGSYHQRQRLYWVADSNDKRLERRIFLPECTDEQFARPDGLASSMADAENKRCQPEQDKQPTRILREEFEPKKRIYGSSNLCTSVRAWSQPDWIECRDNKLRPIKPGLEPLANGIPARVVRLRGYGNAIVPQVAAEFVSAFYEVIESTL